MSSQLQNFINPKIENGKKLDLSFLNNLTFSHHNNEFKVFKGPSLAHVTIIS